MTQQESRENLVRLLRLAYSAEMAAMYAYRGHWHSLRDTRERNEVRSIEREEWLHRRQLGHILKELSVRPSLILEIKYFLIGKALDGLGYLAGWFLPMYGAGLLESKNYHEYELAAEYAWDCGHQEYVKCFLSMAELEWEHEGYFRCKVESHWGHHYLPLWEKLPPKVAIRARFEFDSPLLLNGLKNLDPRPIGEGLTSSGQTRPLQVA